MKPSPTFGPFPRQQANWDWRAAGNFMCGGAGAGLIVFAVLSGIGGARFVATLAGGLALVGAGLFFVWLEIGRPWRAMHVFINPRQSWMTREAMVAAVMFPAGLAAMFVPALGGLVLLLALGFVYCQARMLQAAKGIPAWREPMLVPLVVVTGLAEGGGLFLLAQPQHAADDGALLALFGALVLARLAIGYDYRRRLGTVAARGALAALDATGRLLLYAGTVPALAAALLVATGAIGGLPAWTLLAAAGALAAAAGAHFKHTLVTRAGFNQGFALTHLPVRGVRRKEV
jgi:phenylacetyl-CoA:acceptor oxidoreductase subunit 2